MAAIRDAFTGFRFGLTIDREFKTSNSRRSTAAALQAALSQAIDALATLRAMSYAELIQLPAHKTIELAGYGRRVTLTTYMDLLKSKNSDLQIAVQVFAHGRLEKELCEYT
jgi:hypothetical protein